MKIIKILIINLILLAVILIGIDYSTFRIVFKNEKPSSRLTKIYIKQFGYKNLTKELLYNTHFREPENVNSNKKPIILFGCSFAWGHGLNKDELFSHLLSKQTNRPVYNRALSGMSTQFMLYQLRNDEFYKIVPKPEYVIYVYMQSHIPRIHFGIQGRLTRSLFYKEKTSKSNEKYLTRDYLKETIYRNYLAYLLNDNIRFKRMRDKPSKKELELLQLHFLEARKEINEHWGNDVKFVVLLYESENYINKIKSIFPEMEDAGIIIVDINKLSNKDFKGKEYQISAKDAHPNARAWKELTPLLVKKLGL